MSGIGHGTARAHAAGGEESSPAVSVVVPVHNDAAGLRVTVTSLLAQDPGGPSWEVVIVDNGSSDETLATAEALAREAPDRVRVLQESRIRSSYAARNLGARASTGAVLCFVDADMSVPTDYVAAVAALFRTSDADYVGCAVELYALTGSLAARYNLVHGFRVREYVERVHFAPTCCLCVRRRVFEELGGFDWRLESSGDLEFGQRVHAAGYRQRYAPHIVLRHPARESYRALLAKERRLARGVAQLVHYHPERYGHRATRPWSGRLYLPTRPARIRDRFIEAGQEIRPLEATIFSVWSMPLKWTAALAQLREGARLRAVADGAGRGRTGW